MGFGRKVGAFLGLVPDDGRQPAGFEEDYPEHQYQSEYSGEYRGEFGGDYGNERRGHTDGYQDEYPTPSYAAPAPERRPAADTGFAPEPVIQGALAVQPRYEPRRDPDSKAATRPVTVKLASFTEARVIGEKYRDGQSVIMDMTEMADADARRLVDFAAGLAFARRGSIDKVTTKVFMLLPSDVSFDDVAMDRSHEYAAAYGR